MESRTSSLIGNRKNFAIVEYTDEYKKYLEQLREIDNEFADSIEHNHGYIILRHDCRCLGEINIKIPENESKIEIKLHLREKYLHSLESFSSILEEIIKSIGVYYFDKEDIEINLINNIDLSRINSYKYQKSISENNKIIYTCSNRINQAIIPMLAKEMNKAEEILTGGRKSLGESIEDHVLIDTEGNIHVDQDFRDKIKNGTITLPELFSKIETVFLEEINATKSHRNICFSNDGHVRLFKWEKGHNNSTSCHFSYHLLHNGFKLESKVKKDNTIDVLNVNEASYYTEIKTNQASLFYSKDKKRKIIHYIGPKVNNTSISIDLYVNEQNEIERCNIDFRVHKNNGKIKGVYALRIVPQRDYAKLVINYISRGGIRYSGFLEKLLEKEEDLFLTLISGNLTDELIDELIIKIVPIFNDWAKSNGKQPISTTDTVTISSMMDIEENTVDFLKQLSGENPLPHLQNIIKKFITTNEKSKNDAKKKVLHEL